MTSDNVTEAEPAEPSEAVPSKPVDDQLIDEVVGPGSGRGPSADRRGRTAPAAHGP